MPAGEIQEGQGASLCDELEASLPQLTEAELSGELSQARREELLAHALACTRCGESLRTYRALLSRLKGLPGIVAPSGFSRRIEEILRSDRAVQPAFSWRVTSRVLPLAAMAVVGVAIVFALRDRPQVDGPPVGVELAQAPQPVRGEVEGESAAFDEAKERKPTLESALAPRTAPPGVSPEPLQVEVARAKDATAPTAPARGFDQSNPMPGASGAVHIDVSLASSDAGGLERLRNLARSFSGEDLLFTEIGAHSEKAEARTLLVRVPAGKVAKFRDAVLARGGAGEDLKREGTPPLVVQAEAKSSDALRFRIEEAPAQASYPKKAGAASPASPASPKEEATTEAQITAAKGDIVRSRAAKSPPRPGGVVTGSRAPAPSPPKLEVDESRDFGGLVTVEIRISFRD